MIITEFLPSGEVRRTVEVKNMNDVALASQLLAVEMPIDQTDLVNKLAGRLDKATTNETRLNSELQTALEENQRLRHEICEIQKPEEKEAVKIDHKHIVPGAIVKIREDLVGYHFYGSNSWIPRMRDGYQKVGQTHPDSFKIDRGRDHCYTPEMVEEIIAVPVKYEDLKEGGFYTWEDYNAVFPYRNSIGHLSALTKHKGPIYKVLSLSMQKNGFRIPGSIQNLMNQAKENR